MIHVSKAGVSLTLHAFGYQNDQMGKSPSTLGYPGWLFLMDSLLEELSKAFSNWLSRQGPPPGLRRAERSQQTRVEYPHRNLGSRHREFIKRLDPKAKKLKV